MDFTKMHGLGNDFIIAEADSFEDAAAFRRCAAQLCDRHTGIGADGLILIGKDPDYDMFMRIFNSDGSEAQMCGNGIRCAAIYARKNQLVNKDHFSVKTMAGPRYPEIYQKGATTLVRVDMGEPELSREKIPVTGAGSNTGIPILAAGRSFTGTAVSMGNPHCIIYVEDINAVPLEQWGPQIETHELFPEKTNVEFVQVRNNREIDAIVWERGAGVTLACGTGACAILTASVLNQKTEREAVVRLPGGELSIFWNEADNHVYMSGPAVEVFKGQINLE